ncbi:MAG TPA: Chromate resistance protein ChrB [Gemmatimonadales bacterium]|nr:Chromate resistance protein ChrB [Gemmatimonadales bacterium]
MATPWMLLSSRLPREPSRLRLGVWRRLKRLGAILVHDAVWILPADAKTREAFEWLAEEIAEQGGTAFVWEVRALDAPQDQEIVRRFRAEADARYAAIAASAEAIRRGSTRGKTQPRPPAPERARQALRQLRGLERALRLERRRDYFRAPGRAGAEAAVRVAIETLEAHRRATAPEPATHERTRHALGH